MLYTADVISKLVYYIPVDALEAAHARSILDFLAHSDAPFLDSNAQGHVTASAIVLDEMHENLLLIYHPKMQRWLQPGGHCHPTLDDDVFGTALRELTKETGITQDLVSVAQTMLFDVDVHQVLGTSGRHSHYDLRFLFVLRSQWYPTISHVRWFSVAEVASGSDESLSRFARKILQLSTQSY